MLTHEACCPSIKIDCSACNVQALCNDHHSAKLLVFCGVFSTKRDYVVLNAACAAGADTSGVTLSMTLWLLAQHPASLERARREAKLRLGSKDIAEWTSMDIRGLPYTTACIKEAMRLFPAAPYTGRIATQNVIINGQQISEGELCFLDHYSVHRHEDFWPRYQVSPCLLCVQAARLAMCTLNGLRQWHCQPVTRKQCKAK